MAKFNRLLKERGAALDLTICRAWTCWARQGLHRPKPKYMAQIMGARKTFYLVNGATGGLEAAILAMSQPDRPVLPGHGHMSILNGAILSGCLPAFTAAVDEEWGAARARDPALARAEVLRQDWQLLVSVSPPTTA